MSRLMFGDVTGYSPILKNCAGLVAGKVAGLVLVRMV